MAKGGDCRAAASSRVSLRTKIVGLLCAVILVFSVVFIAYTYVDQRARIESEMLEQSRMLVTEMDAVWDFVSINQRTINYTSDGEYDFKSLHCAIAGKAVAVLFSRNSDYLIRFTNLNPRNIYNEPDEYERTALEGFYENPTADETYGYATFEGERVFRYVRSMKYVESCMECHGAPVGEPDPTGYPKEGAAVGGVAGAVSVVVPTALYEQNMRAAIAGNVLLFVALLVCMVVVIYQVLSHLVTEPLTRLGASLARMGEGRVGAAGLGGSAGPDGPAGMGLMPVPARSEAWSSREVDELFEQFSAMAGRLSELYTNLESQVTERTQQLSEANAELELQRAQVEQANDRLVSENRYKSDFLAIVSHELRTPLTSILAFTELLASSVDPADTAVARQVAEVEKNGAVLLEMVDNILETARIQAGSERLNLELIDLNDIVGMVEASNDSMALKRGVAFSTSVDGDVPLITSDWEKVRRILVNLVSNAIKFTPEGGRVGVRVEYDAPSGMVEMEVADTGIGIPADKQELVFERFTQENMSTVRRYGGSGLGLSLVKDLVAMLGGTVGLVSEPGQGSTFTVRLPHGGPEDAGAVSGTGGYGEGRDDG